MKHLLDRYQHLQRCRVPLDSIFKPKHEDNRFIDSSCVLPIKCLLEMLSQTFK